MAIINIPDLDRELTTLKTNLLLNLWDLGIVLECDGTNWYVPINN